MYQGYNYGPTYGYGRRRGAGGGSPPVPSALNAPEILYKDNKGAGDYPPAIEIWVDDTAQEGVHSIRLITSATKGGTPIINTLIPLGASTSALIQAALAGELSGSRWIRANLEGAPDTPSLPCPDVLHGITAGPIVTNSDALAVNEGDTFSKPLTFDPSGVSVRRVRTFSGDQMERFAISGNGTLGYSLTNYYPGGLEYEGIENGAAQQVVLEILGDNFATTYFTVNATVGDLDEVPDAPASSTISDVTAGGSTTVSTTVANMIAGKDIAYAVTGASQVRRIRSGVTTIVPATGLVRLNDTLERDLAHAAGYLASTSTALTLGDATTGGAVAGTDTRITGQDPSRVNAVLWPNALPWSTSGAGGSRTFTGVSFPTAGKYALVVFGGDQTDTCVLSVSGSATLRSGSTGISLENCHVFEVTVAAAGSQDITVTATSGNTYGEVGVYPLLLTNVGAFNSSVSKNRAFSTNQVCASSMTVAATGMGFSFIWQSDTSTLTGAEVTPANGGIRLAKVVPMANRALHIILQPNTGNPGGTLVVTSGGPPACCTAASWDH